MPERTRWQMLQGLALSGGIVLLLVLFFLHLSWRTLFHYVEPGQMLVVIAKTGTPLPPGQILAHKGQKGIQEEVLGEGRHFVMPVSNETGNPSGDRHSARQDRRGHGQGWDRSAAWSGVGRSRSRRASGARSCPGRHRLNPYGYEVQLRPAVRIRPGFVGFVTSLLGQEPSVLPILVRRACSRMCSSPGSTTSIPMNTEWRKGLVGINQVSFLKESHLRFPSEDAFEIELEATVEWELLPEHVAQVMAEFGRKEAIEEKVIVPQSRSIGRIEGSKHGAKEFLLDRRVSNFKTTSKQSSSGLASRKTSTFCRRLFGTLLSRIPSWHRSKNPLSPLRRKRLPKSGKKRAAVLPRERERTLIEQRRREVQAETAALVATIGAQTEQEIANIEAHTRLRVAEMQQQIAALEAERTRTLGTARAEVVALRGHAMWPAVLTRKSPPFAAMRPPLRAIISPASWQMTSRCASFIPVLAPCGPTSKALLASATCPA